MEGRPTQPRRTPGTFRPILAALLTGIAVSGGVAAGSPLKVTFAPQSIVLTPGEFSRLPHTEFTAYDSHEKKEHRYSGVAVRDILSRVGAPFGEKLRGPAMRLAVIFRSKDGYSTLFALAEFDEEFSSRTILLADGEDGGPLPPNFAPFRLIAPGDRRSARWARMVTSIEVVQVPVPAP
jgi:DMSO/TMAO reductase YedYZ molybdopterin-dependent catalytic subunit